MLGRLIDAVALRLQPALPAGVSVGDASPTALADLPLVALAIERAARRLIGVGAIPRGTIHGALPVDLDVNLADPRVRLDGDETLVLLSADRRTLTLPNGPVVRGDGNDETPFGTNDVIVTDPEPFTVVGAAPAGRQVRVDPEQGTLEFGVALADTGTLRVRYHIGQWETVTTRYQGALVVTVVGSDAAATRSLSRQVATALDAPGGAVRLVPTAWRAAEVLAVGDDTARRQVLEYRFDAEIEDPLVPTSGGVITTVAVAVDVPDPADTSPDETFEIR